MHRFEGTVNQYTGEPFPWEHRQATASGDLNTDNGNKISKIDLFGWKQRGGLAVGFCVYHNSRSTTHLELGFNWSSSADMWVKTGAMLATVIKPDGQNIPFDQNDGDGLYYPRAGIHDSLALSGGNWIYTTKHKIVYTFNSNGALVSIADWNSM